MAQIKKVRWTPLALRDLNEAYDYIAQERLSAAQGIIHQVERALDALIQYPQMGRGGRVAGTRELYIVNTPFLIAYRVDHDHLQILAFMHAARMWPDSFE
jgi:addiction module RelE/StbE family toxin